MEFRQENGFPLLPPYFSDVKPAASPENLHQNSRFFKHLSSPHGCYKPNTHYNNLCHLENLDRGIDLNYSDQYRHTSPLLGGTTIEGSSSNPFGQVDLHRIEGFSPFDACYNQSVHHNPNHQSNDLNFFPYASAASVSFSDSQKAVIHGGWGEYDDEDHRHPHNHHHQMSYVQPQAAATQEASCVEQPPFINYQKIGTGVMLPAADAYSCNMVFMDHDQLRKKKLHYMKEASKQHEGDGGLIKGQWTEEEDRLLSELVETNGIKKWSLIAAKLNGRVGKQCRERWHNHLRPDIRKEMWSIEEDKILIQAHMELGNRWAEITKRLPGRTENTIKNHWNATKRKRYIKRRPSNKINHNAKGNSTSTVNESILLSKYIKSVERAEERRNGKAAVMDEGEPSSPAASKVYRCRFERKNCKATNDVPDYPSKFDKKSPVKTWAFASASRKNKDKVDNEEVYEQSRGLFDLPDSDVYRPQFEANPHAWMASFKAAAAARKKQHDSSSVEATVGSSSSYSEMYSEFNGYGNDTRLSLEVNGYMQEQGQSKKPDVDLLEMINNAKCQLSF